MALFLFAATAQGKLLPLCLTDFSPALSFEGCLYPSSQNLLYCLHGHLDVYMSNICGYAKASTMSSLHDAYEDDSSEV
ncbi:hypothetical protein GCM10009426_28350 [Rheinheimera tangshanensis]|nr:hypothetical protein GCM10010920_30380 [Rheinheimera tangshanensis]